MTPLTDPDLTSRAMTCPSPGTDRRGAARRSATRAPASPSARPPCCCSARCTACCRCVGAHRLDQVERRAVLHLHVRAEHAPLAEHRRPHRVPRRPLLAVDGQHRPLRRASARSSRRRLGAGGLRAGEVRVPRQGHDVQHPARGRAGARRDPGDPAVPAAGEGRAHQHVLVGAAAAAHQPVRHLPGPHLRGGRGARPISSRRPAPTAPASCSSSTGSRCR